MSWINVCRWLTLQRTRRTHGWNFPKRLKEPAARREMSAWSLRDYELMVGEWAALWLVVGGIAVVPGYWVILQWAPQLATAFGVLILIGPLSALVCLIEIYIRWLIGFLLPNSPVGLMPGRPSFFNRGSLLLSSLATYALIPILYVFLDTYVMPAGL